MKKFISKIVLIVAIALSYATLADAQVRVRIRPTITINERPARPTPHHVWVNGEWRYNNNNYEYTQGYWAQPSRHNNRWVDGHWRHDRNGWYWVPGHWRYKE